MSAVPNKIMPPPRGPFSGKKSADFGREVVERLTKVVGNTAPPMARPVPWGSYSGYPPTAYPGTYGPYTDPYAASYDYYGYGSYGTGYGAGNRVYNYGGTPADYYRSAASGPYDRRDDRRRNSRNRQPPRNNRKRRADDRDDDRDDYRDESWRSNRSVSPPPEAVSESNNAELENLKDQAKVLVNLEKSGPPAETFEDKVKKLNKRLSILFNGISEWISYNDFKRLYARVFEENFQKFVEDIEKDGREVLAEHPEIRTRFTEKGPEYMVIDLPKGKDKEPDTEEKEPGKETITVPEKPTDKKPLIIDEFITSNEKPKDQNESPESKKPTEKTFGKAPKTKSRRYRSSIEAANVLVANVIQELDETEVLVASLAEAAQTEGLAEVAGFLENVRQKLSSVGVLAKSAEACLNVKPEGEEGQAQEAEPEKPEADVEEPMEVQEQETQKQEEDEDQNPPEPVPEPVLTPEELPPEPPTPSVPEPPRENDNEIFMAVNSCLRNLFKEVVERNKVVYSALDLSDYLSVEDLASRTEADHLKSELQRRGLKFGGTKTQRAERLWFIKDMPPEEYPKRLLGKKGTSTS